MQYQNFKVFYRKKDYKGNTNLPGLHLNYKIFKVYSHSTGLTNSVASIKSWLIA